MQWHHAYLLAVSWGALDLSSYSSSSSSSSRRSRSRVDAFQPPATLPAKAKAPPRGGDTLRRTPTTLRVGGMGWDNENYLNALGQGDDAISKANAEYDALSRFGRRPAPAAGGDDDDDVDNAASATLMPGGGALPARRSDELPARDALGAVLTEEMKAQMRAAHDNPDEEASQGGKFFREMLARAQQGASLAPAPAAVVPPPSSASYVPPPPQPPAIPANSLDSLSVEQQAELFRQMMATQQQQQQQLAAAAVPPAPEIIDPTALPRRSAPADAKKPGRNRDADAIVNSSDVYFAQLKLDSSIRNQARYQGDLDKANKVFDDPQIHAIKVHVNPYIEEMRKKEQMMLETAADEMIIFDGNLPNGPVVDKPKDYAGPSYRDRLRQRKQKGQGQDQAAAPSGSLAAAPVPVQKPPEPVASSSVPAQATQVSSPSASPAESAATLTSITTITPKDYAGNEDSLRRDIRTFMGLLLKHRGGPGFGSGRLKTEADRELFESLSSMILSRLRQESMLLSASEPQQSASSHSNHAVSPSSSHASPTTLNPQQTVAASSSSSPPASSFPVSSEVPDAGRVKGTISCIEGGIQMYRNSPAELRESVLTIFRAALLSAVNTVTEILSPGAPAVPPPPPQSPYSGPQDREQRINSMVSLIEGAIVMYKNSPPELHSSILVTLRGALLAGIGTLNSIIAENEVQNLQAYQAASPSTAAAPAATVPPAKREFYDVIPASQVASAGVSSQLESALPDENSIFFEQLHVKLQQAKGSGVMGLRTDMDAASAADLADDLAKMRTLLVKELEQGVPSSASPATSSTGASSASSTASKYQEMLAKARAEKEGLQ
jgi:hypothetical protein